MGEEMVFKEEGRVKIAQEVVMVSENLMDSLFQEFKEPDGYVVLHPGREGQVGMKFCFLNKEAVDLMVQGFQESCSGKWEETQAWDGAFLEMQFDPEESWVEKHSSD